MQICAFLYNKVFKPVFTWSKRFYSPICSFIWALVRWRLFHWDEQFCVFPYREWLSSRSVIPSYVALFWCSKTCNLIRAFKFHVFQLPRLLNYWCIPLNQFPISSANRLRHQTLWIRKVKWWKTAFIQTRMVIIKTTEIPFRINFFRRY